MRPVQVGPGPLLFFMHPEDEDGQSVPSGYARFNVAYVYDPAHDRPPQEFWRGNPTNLIPRPIARPKANLLVCEQSDRACIVEFDSGNKTPLLNTTDRTEVIEVKDGVVFFLDHKLTDALGSIQLDHLPDGTTITKNYFRPRDWLYVRDVTPSAQPKRVGEIEIERLLSVNEQGLWVVTTGSDRKLARIRRDGTIDEIMVFDSHWVARESHAELSPGGKLLSLALLHDQHDFWKERELLVFDLAAKKVVLSKAHLAATAAWSSSYLDVEWLDETRLWCSGLPEPGVLDVQSDVLVDVQTAERLFDKVRPSNVAEGRTQVGYFETAVGLLYFKGDDKPVASMLEGGATSGITHVNDLDNSPDGVWAAFSSPVDNVTYLVDGRNKRKSLLMSGWSHEIHWLPEADD